MQCEYEAQARILQNYWQFIRQSIQRIMLADSSSEGKKINKEGRLVALTMGISAYVLFKYFYKDIPIFTDFRVLFDFLLKF